MKVQIVLSSDIDRCPKRSLLAAHYLPDGSCKCADRDQITKDLTEARAVAARANARVRELVEQLREA